MSFIESSDYNPSSVLFGLEKNLSNIIKLHKISRLPKVLMLSGDKGIGKFTLIYHFLVNHFDKNNYDLNKFKNLIKNKNEHKITNLIKKTKTIRQKVISLNQN